MIEKCDIMSIIMEKGLKSPPDSVKQLYRREGKRVPEQIIVPAHTVPYE